MVWWRCDDQNVYRKIDLPAGKRMYFTIREGELIKVDPIPGQPAAKIIQIGIPKDISTDAVSLSVEDRIPAIALQQFDMFVDAVNMFADAAMVDGVTEIDFPEWFASQYDGKLLDSVLETLTLVLEKSSLARREERTVLRDEINDVLAKMVGTC